jgi:ABC-type dipeptide/oligopeptide/nickel transport system permease subunit
MADQVMAVQRGGSAAARVPGAGDIASHGEWFRIWRRFRRNRPALVGLAIVGAIALLSMFPEAVAPYSPYAVNSSLRGSGPSAMHPFGMDQVGRDVLSRVIFGARVAMLVGLAATGLSLLVGVLVGATAGYFGGLVDVLLMRLVDALQAFPILVLLIAIAAALGPSLQNVIVILGLTTWAQYARIVRADVLSLREREFVVAARTLGVPTMRIILRHILPNALGPIIVLASLSVAGVILLESALSFLGLGTQPPTASWGSMLADGRTYILTYPHIALFPGVAITVAVLALNLLGDGLRDALDPRTRT